MGGARLSRAARRISRRRQGEGPVDSTSKAYADADQVNGKLDRAAVLRRLRSFSYYRKDLLEKYKRPVPKTWDEMMETAKIVMDGEKNAAAAGLLDRRLADRRHGVHVPRAAVGRGQRHHRGRQAQPRHRRRRAQPFQLYGRMKQAGVLPKNIAEIPTDRIRIDMQAGNLIFGMSWGYVWNRLENDADTQGEGQDRR